MGVLAGIGHLTQRNRVLVMDMLMDPERSNLEASHAALTANVERIQTLWKDYAAKPLGAEEQALAQAFADANATYLDKGLIPASAALVAGSTTAARAVHHPDRSQRAQGAGRHRAPGGTADQRGRGRV